LRTGLTCSPIIKYGDESMPLPIHCPGPMTYYNPKDGESNAATREWN
jgi:hypothetical protein